MKKTLLLLLIINLTCMYGQEDSKIIEEFRYGFDESVSIINLIASPEKYHNKKIQVIGYLNIEFEGNGIYLHKEDYDNGIEKNGLWVSFTKKTWEKLKKKKINKTYVIIEGTFNMEDKGHMGLFSGEIEKITRIDKWN
ncbi:hypothetical protein QVZ41_14330 [Wenyingzhuangia sp. chi5]|uniref:Uncharacterized protein n=1 Tax=Wenyingzhuangia gilva TaxID=3057677 RepID=A0ABT8VVP3_9FLAO|nr:hypothetical protein [Wenyingzhuangia sp. chi5]MDO3696026.1 hypothetical protein [Wenyingzhuangia sp. chi5]